MSGRPNEARLAILRISPSYAPPSSEAGRQTTCVGRSPLKKSSRASLRTRIRFSRVSSTERRPETQSRCWTGRRSRGSQGIGDGCGTANFAAALGFAGSAGRGAASALSGTYRLCSRAVETRPRLRDACAGRDVARGQGGRPSVCRTDHAARQRGFTAVSRRMACFIQEFVTPPALGSRRELRYRVHIDGTA